jgi:hypothetical protein
VAFDPGRVANLDSTYEVRVDERLFRFAVRDRGLAEARGEPQVRLTATAPDLVALRLAVDAGTRSSAASRIKFEGTDRAQARFRTLFGLPRAQDDG